MSEFVVYVDRAAVYPDGIEPYGLRAGSALQRLYLIVFVGVLVVAESHFHHRQRRHVGLGRQRAVARHRHFQPVAFARRGAELRDRLAVGRGGAAHNFGAFFQKPDFGLVHRCESCVFASVGGAPIELDREIFLRREQGVDRHLRRCAGFSEVVVRIAARRQYSCRQGQQQDA